MSFADPIVPLIGPSLDGERFPTEHSMCVTRAGLFIRQVNTGLMITAQEALWRLENGNRQFVEVLENVASPLNPISRMVLAKEQQPFAIILGCSDSRVPAEIVFNQGLGDLFVIRVAGNIVAPSQIGSVEFAAERFGTALVVVMGHTGCGAIEATVQAVRNPANGGSENLMSIVNRIRPTVTAILDANPTISEGDLIKSATRANVRSSAQQLMYGSPILEKLIRDGKLRVVGAEYSIESGRVEFLVSN